VLNAGALNDTGITDCTDNSSIQPCLVVGFPRQDAEMGRDAAALAGKLDKKGGGHAGFDYTKLDGAGKPLPVGATAWVCVRDNVTGLVWENKTADGGLRDSGNTYSWYNPDSATNGGWEGVQDGGACSGSACDTYAYAKAVNAKKLCGFTAWRLPSRRELQSLVDFSIAYPGPMIDGEYFVNMLFDGFWSASPSAYGSDYAWGVNFNYGVAGNANKKDYGSAVRLVRGGQ
jgi:hypothetical protein